MANIDRAFSIDNWIELADPLTGLTADSILIAQGSVDPTIGLGFEAPIGSFYLRRNGSIYSKNGVANTAWTLNGNVNGVAWGDITGILANQTDLQTALNNRVLIAGDTMTGNLNISPTTGNSTLTLKSPTVTSTAGIDLQNSAGTTIYTEVFDETTGNVLFDSASGSDLVFSNTTNGDLITLNNVTFQKSAGTGYIMPLTDGTLNQVIQTDGTGNLTFVTLPNATDELVKVSATDTTAGFLLPKLLGGTLITTVLTNPGFNEAVTINTSAEINTASNLGAGAGVFGTKVGSDLRLKSLVAGTNVTLTSTANEITINSTATGGDPNQNLWETITADTGSTIANTITDNLTISGGTGISTSIAGDILTISSTPINVQSASSQYRNTLGVLDIPLVWTNYVWNVIDLETDITVIQQSTTNQADINIKSTGTYFFFVKFHINDDVQLRFRINDTTVIPSSFSSLGNAIDGQEPDTITVTGFVASLVAGQKVTMQIMSRTTFEDNLVINGDAASLSIIKVDGVKGDKGDPGAPGSGSSIIIKEEGITLPNTPHTELNFIGTELTATDAGAGIANVTLAPIFGSQFQHVESLGVTTTTSTTFLNKLTMVTPSLPAGTYRIEVGYGWNHNAIANDFEARVRENAVNIGEIHKQEPKDAAGGFSTTGSNQRHLAYRVYYRTLTAGIRTYTLDFRTSRPGTNSSIWDTTLTIWRVA